MQNNRIYYNFDTDTAFRVVGVFGDLMHVKPIKANTLRAKMNERPITLTFEQSFKFFEGFTEVKNIESVRYLKALHKQTK